MSLNFGGLHCPCSTSLGWLARGQGAQTKQNCEHLATSIRDRPSAGPVFLTVRKKMYQFRNVSAVAIVIF